MGYAGQIRMVPVPIVQAVILGDTEVDIKSLFTRSVRRAS